MSKRSDLVIVGAAGLLLAVLPAVAQKSHRVKAKTAPVETAVIENTGSTNTLGYRVLVNSNGKVSGVVFHRYQDDNVLPPQWPTLSRAVVAKLFADLGSAVSLASLPVGHGMRSASFGTATYVTYKGQRSPDLTFGGDTRANALKADIAAITRTLHVGNAPRRPSLMRRPIALHSNSANKP